jgi:hypothetical protein
MSIVIRVAFLVYVAQATFGLVVGFTLPWLQIFGTK